MSRQKTPLRLLLEEYFNDHDEITKDDWLDIPYQDKRELNVIRSMLNSLKKEHNALVVVDKDEHTVWVHRNPNFGLAIVSPS